MPRLSPDRLPKYRRHKATGQAVVTLDGKDHYLGKHNSAASKRAYDRLVSQWQQNGRTLPPGDDPTIVELCAAFWRHAKSHYVKNGSPTDEQCGIRVCLKYLKSTYRDILCRDFGPRDLKAIQQQMIDAGNSRSYINQNTCRLKHIFMWGVANDLVPVEVHQRLATVSGLAKGKTKAKECAPILPVDLSVGLADYLPSPANLRRKCYSLSISRTVFSIIGSKPLRLCDSVVTQRGTWHGCSLAAMVA